LTLRRVRRQQLVRRGVLSVSHLATSQLANGAGNQPSLTPHRPAPRPGSQIAIGHQR
jgi:hypothetical protein